MAGRAEHYQQVIAGLSPLQKLMLDLDTVLTGNAPTEVVRQYHHYPDTLEKWMEEPGGNPIWYLSDSGYSRVVWNDDRGDVFLTSNSTSKVKANWDKAGPQREALERFLRGEYNRLSTEAGLKPRFETAAAEVVDTLLEVRWTEPIPPKMAFDNPDTELEFHTRQPLTAWSYADEKGHHPKLWAAVKGSVYEPMYRKKFDIREGRSPDMKTLKNNRTELDDTERKEVMRRGAVWHHGKGGKPTPAVWKSEVRGKTYYVCNTHRAAQVKPTLKGAIRAFDFIKTTS